MGDYKVCCQGCGSVLHDLATSCRLDPGLPRAVYSQKRLEIADLPGVWRHLAWLPVKSPDMRTGAGSVCYQSQGLAREIGLQRLFISFSGFWPEMGASMVTGSFKELEAAPTMQRLSETARPVAGVPGGHNAPVLVVASAGNTARAFAQTASLTGRPVVLFVPTSSLHRLWTTVEPGRICLAGVEGDYLDAIQAADRLASRPGFLPEGGARNIARRDGMGTVMLEAAATAGVIPDHYFQAVGSGTGGIAAWEAALRLAGDGRFGSNIPRLHLAQNLPCAPIHRLWTGPGGESPSGLSEIWKGLGCPDEMYDDVLFNRNPPYAIPGGVEQALRETSGAVLGVANDEAEAARQLFESSEGIDILPAPAVAVAALLKAMEDGAVRKEEMVLLNITGGGVKRSWEELGPSILPCQMKVRPGHPADDLEKQVLEFIRS
ncbi:MAG: Cysteate synthase [Methanosaeta sp. PtaB.Bin039]|nr:MAG: Cysteate synthase [Methanosaeta sp. PtaB.Bin039]